MSIASEISNDTRKKFFSSIQLNNTSYFSELLQKHPLLLNMPDQDGNSPVCVAIMFTRLEMATMLIEKGATLITPDDQEPLLHTAVIRRAMLPVAELMLERGVNVNARMPITERTALHAIAEYGSIRMAQLLLRFQPHLAAKDSNGKTPLDLAMQAGRDEMVALFLDHTAEITATTQIATIPLDIGAGYMATDVNFRLSFQMGKVAQQCGQFLGALGEQIVSKFGFTLKVDLDFRIQMQTQMDTGATSTRLPSTGNILALPPTHFALPEPSITEVHALTQEEAYTSSEANQQIPKAARPK